MKRSLQYILIVLLISLAGAASAQVNDCIDGPDDCLWGRVCLDTREEITNCNNPNGKLNIRGSKAGATFNFNANYSIVWRNTESGAIISTNSQASNLNIGTYSATVTSNVGGVTCSSTKTYYVGYALPAMSISNLVHVADCNPTSMGQFTIHASTVTAAKGNETYSVTVWQNDPNNVIISYGLTPSVLPHTQVVTGLLPGEYVVRIANGNCFTDDVVVTIEDQRVYPSAAVTATPQTTCSPLAPNGTLSVTSPNAGYTYTWYAGNALVNPLGTGSPMSGLAAGNYSLVIRNNATMCDSVKNNLVVGLNQPVFNVAAVTVSDWTNCVTPNGSVSANVAGTTAGYTFNWYDGLTVLAVPTTTANPYTGLQNGSFTVRAIDNVTQCPSANSITVSVADMRAAVVLPTVNQINNSSCNGTGNGSLTVTTTLAGHSYQWFNGANTLPGNAMPVGAAISGLSGVNTYRLLVTNTSTGCTSFQDYTIQNIPEVIVALPVVVTAPVRCAAPWDGVVSASVQTPVGGSTYTYNWYVGNTVVNPPAQSGSNANFSALQSGDYTVTITNQLGCTSVAATVPLPSASTNPAIPVPVIVGNTACAVTLHNGSITIDPTPTGDPYSYQWFLGATNITGTVGNDPNATGLAPGSYSVTVTNTATACFVTRANMDVTTTPHVPVIAATPVNLTSCIVSNGSISATVDASSYGGGNPAPAAEYNFTWNNVSGGTTGSGGTGPSITNLAAGTYSVFATEITTGCISNTAQPVVGNPPATIVTVTQVIDNNSCDPTYRNGRIIVSASGGANPATDVYQFSWTAGVVSSGLNNIDTAYSLGSGNYTVTALRNPGTEDCSGVNSATVATIPFVPDITANKTDPTSCNPPNGEIYAYPTSATDTAQYVFTWYDVNNNVIDVSNPLYTPFSGTPPAYPTNTSGISGISGGDFTVIAYSPWSRCEAMQRPTVSVLPVGIVLNETTIPVPGDCNQLGHLVVEASGTPGEIFNFTWYVGQMPVIPSDSIISSVSEIIPIIRNVVGDFQTPGTFTQGAASELTHSRGRYTVMVKSQSSQCVSFGTFDLEGVEPDHDALATPTITSGCGSTYEDGEILGGVEQLGIPVINPVLAGYTFFWFEGNSVKYSPVFGDNPGNLPRYAFIPDFPTNINLINSLPPGNYVLVVEDNSVNRCRSEEIYITVGTPDDPTVDQTVVVNNTNCIPGTPNGSMTVEAVYDLANYRNNDGPVTYTWYSGQQAIAANQIGAVDNFTPGAPSTRGPAPGLLAGTYRVDVSVRGCTGFGFFNIIDDLRYPSIALSDLTIEPQEHCIAPFNGSIDVNSFTDRDGNPIVAPFPLFPVPGGYQVELFDANNVGISTGTSHTPLVQGQYYIHVVDQNACPSNLLPVTVDFVPILPSYTMDTIKNHICDVSITQNGSITVNGLDGAYGYDYNWTDANGNVLGSNFDLLDIRGGLYSVAVTNQTSRCTVPQSVFLEDHFKIPAITQTNQVSQTYCAPSQNGEAHVMQIMENGLVAAFGDYTIDFTRDVSIPPSMQSAIGNNILNSVTAGTYYSFVTTVATGCISSAVPIVVLGDTIMPQALFTTTDNTACNPNVDGNINAAIMNNAAAVASAGSAAYSWVINPDPMPQGTLVGNSVNFTNLGADPLNLGSNPPYTLTVTNTVNSCISVGSAQIFDIPVYPVINAASSTIVNKTNCSPANGAITINQITNGAIADFTFEWYMNGIAVADLMAGQTTNNVSPLDTARYYAFVTKLSTAPGTGASCRSQFPAEFTIIQQTTNPAIEAVITDNTYCIGGSGVIDAQVNESGARLTTGYTFAWYAGNVTVAEVQAGTATPSTFPTSPFGVNNIHSQLPSGIYTVFVTDNIGVNQNCTNVAGLFVDNNFGFPDEVIATSTPQINCVPLDGSLTVTGVIVNGANMSPLGFTYEWFDPVVDLTIPISTSNPLINQGFGTYLVKALDNITQCRSRVFSPWEIQDQRAFATLNFANTYQMNCHDPAMIEYGTFGPVAPNGSITVSPVEPATYTFQWYNGLGPALPGNIIAGQSNPQLTGQTSGVYTVVVNSSATGCDTEASWFIEDDLLVGPINIASMPSSSCNPNTYNGSVIVTINGVTSGFEFIWDINGVRIPNNYVSGLAPGVYDLEVTEIARNCMTPDYYPVMEVLPNIPDPIPTIVNGVSSCLQINGTAFVSMINNITDYRIDWYNEITGTSTPFFTGIQNNTLDSGIYAVTAYHLASECLSNVVPFRINDNRIYPDFTITDLRNAICQQNNGSVTIVFDDPLLTDYNIRMNNGTTDFATSTNPTDLASGDYIVTVSTSLGCVRMDSMTIDLDINVYDGVSVNGANDRFMVDCISEFPGNVVRIYNRAGNLVYEASDYDNSTIYFDGRGNRGIYINNKDLPAGTYFFVVDRNDGRKPKTGPVELVR